jgi:TRAP-type C4-dicarboxylate transport system substrate-binding protein
MRGSNQQIWEVRKMKKQTVFKNPVLFSLVLTAILSLFLIGFGTVSAFAEIKLSYANFAPDKTFPGVQLERYKKEVEKRTKGQVKIEAYHGGTLLGAKNMFDGVVSGISDIGTLPPGYHPERFPMIELFGTQLGWPTATAATAAICDIFEKYNLESFKKVKILASFTTTPAHIMSFKPIRNLEDLKGAELRGSGMIVKALELLGAKPVGMPMSEVPEALKKGVVKGLVTSVEVMKDFNFAEYCKYVTKCYLPVAPWVVVMNKKKWDSLPQDVKKVLDDMRKDQSMWTGEYNDKHEKEAIDWSKEKYGVEVITLSSDEIKRWEKLVAPMSKPYMKKREGDVQGNEFWGEMLKLQEKYSKIYPGS